jgi:hypothetical protein
LPCSYSVYRQLLGLFFSQFGQYAVFLIRLEEFGVRRPVRQEEIGKDSSEHSWNTLQDQQPPPAAEPDPVNVIQNPAGYWSTDHVRDGIAHGNQGCRLGQVPVTEPESEVQCDSGPVSRFRHPEKKT